MGNYHFQLVDFVSEPGEFAIRGGIVDVFSYSNERPYRITLFGNEVESIKEFDIETQLSTKKIDEFQLISNMNITVKNDRVSLFEILPKDTIIVTKNYIVDS